jgi:hypothetical protein
MALAQALEMDQEREGTVQGEMDQEREGTGQVEESAKHRI